MKVQASRQKANHNNKSEDRNFGYLVGANIRGKTAGTNSSISLNGKNMAEIITINGTLKQRKGLKTKQKKDKNFLSKKQNKSNVLLYRGINLDEKNGK